MQRVEEEIVKRTPKIEKGIIERLRSERSDELSEAESRHNREQVELINDLKQREIKHIDNINRLEKVNSYNQNFKIICHFSLKTSFFFSRIQSGRSITAAPDKIFAQTLFEGI